MQVIFKIQQKAVLILLLFLIPIPFNAQVFDLLIKNGHVFDPKNNVDGIMDVAVTGGVITQVGPKISEEKAKKIIDASGLWVCPGFIDIHTHVFVGSQSGRFANGINSLSPDDFTFRAGITTVVDAGTSGWRNFDLFKEQVIDQSKTRILAFLNIAGSGMSGNPDQQNIKDMDPGQVAKCIKRYRDIIVGVKIGHYEGASWTPFDSAISACEASDVHLFVECHLPQYSLEEQLNRMRPGDIITHSYEKISERMSVIDDHGKVRPFVLKARDRGILFDVGHGGAGFWFSEAIPALKQGLWPNSFGTDLHRFSMNAGMKDMLNVMSKYMAMGMPLREVFKRATWYPARSIKREDLGHLGIGSEADIAVVRVRKGRFGFIDAGGNRIKGTKRLEAELTVRKGKVVWDLNGLAATAFKNEPSK